MGDLIYNEKSNIYLKLMWAYQKEKDLGVFKQQTFLYTYSEAKPWEKLGLLYPLWLESYEKFRSVFVESKVRSDFYLTLESDLDKYSDRNLEDTLGSKIKEIDLTKKYSRDVLI